MVAAEVIDVEPKEAGCQCQAALTMELRLGLAPMKTMRDAGNPLRPDSDRRVRRFPCDCGPLFCGHSRPAKITNTVKKEAQTDEKPKLVELVAESLGKRKSSIECSTNLIIAAPGIQ